MRLIFGPWTPDSPPHLTEGLQTARNVYPGLEGYRPVGAFDPTLSASLPARCLGAASFVQTQARSIVIAGTETSLYRAQLGGFTQIGTGYSTQGARRWRFVQFGGLAIATNGFNNMLKINLDTNAVTSLSQGAPAGAGTAPKARLLAVVKDFLVAGYINEDPQQIAWSGINNAQWWKFGESQSDYNIMPSGGEVTGIFGGETGIVLQRNRITRMTYVGDNVVFQIDEISSNVGCVSPNTTAQWGPLGFFISDNGFQMWDGSGIKPIGHERVDRYFRSLYSRPDFDTMSTAIDQKNTLVVWSMADGRQFLYNWTLDRWSMCEIEASYVFSGYTRDVSLDELDAFFPNLDEMPYSLDDPRFQGGDPQFFLFDTVNALGTLSGENMPAELAGARIEPLPGRTARIPWTRPISDADGQFSVSIGTAQRLGEDLQTSTYSVMRYSGDLPVRETGRFVVAGMAFEPGARWSYCQGIEFAAQPGPRR